MRKKYKISLNDLESRNGVEKLEHDGFDRSTIIAEMYKKTDGMHDRDRNKLVTNLYDREYK